MMIVGMGNVGAMHGWALSEGGVDVTHVVRKGHAAHYFSAIQLNILDMRKGTPENYRSTYTPKVVDSFGPEDRYDLVMVATNHLQAVDAIRQYREMAGDARFLMFCANWEGPSVIDEILPGRPYVWGYSVLSGARGDDGVLYANIQKTYRVGELPDSPKDLLGTVRDTFSRAGISPEIKENIIEWLWVHHAINAGLQGTVLVYGGLPDSDTPHEVWLLIVRTVKDALKVVEKRGVDFTKDPDTKVFQIGDDNEAARILKNGLLSAPHYERTRAHSHVQANRGEMARYYLDVVETGEKLGVDMPYLLSLKSKILSLQ